MARKIAALLTDMFEDAEYTEPAGAFADSGHAVINVGLEAGRKVKGKKAGTEVEIHKGIDAVTVDEFDALFIPGGFSPDLLRADDRAVQFVADFVKSDKPVFAICHAGQLLITAQVLQGRRFTGYKSIIQDIKNAGAEFIDQEVVIDGNLVSSRNPDDLPAFIAASLKKL